MKEHTFMISAAVSPFVLVILNAVGETEDRISYTTM